MVAIGAQAKQTLTQILLALLNNLCSTLLWKCSVAQAYKVKQGNGNNTKSINKHLITLFSNIPKLGCDIAAVVVVVAIVVVVVVAVAVVAVVVVAVVVVAVAVVAAIAAAAAAVAVVASNVKLVLMRMNIFSNVVE